MNQRGKSIRLEKESILPNRIRIGPTKPTNNYSLKHAKIIYNYRSGRLSNHPSIPPTKKYRVIVNQTIANKIL